MKVVAKELRQKNVQEIISVLAEAKSYLHTVRQKKHSAQAGPQEVRDAIKNIGRIQTVLHEKKIVELKEKAKASGKIPKDLKPKLTRKLRKGLSQAQMKKLGNNKPKGIKRKIFAYVE